MLCENCGERKAEVHFVRIVNGEKREEYICRKCAEAILPLNEAAKMMKLSFSLEGIMNMEEALKSLLLPMIPEIYGLDDREVRCPHCGKTLEPEELMQMFAEDLPAEDDANDEQGEIVPGSVRFDEEVPKRREAYRERLMANRENAKVILSKETETPQGDPVERELAGLRKELDFVLRSEKYERAAEIRDRIFELEKHLTK